MSKNYIIENDGAFFLEGSDIHNAWVFDKQDAARFTEFEASLKTVRMANWRNEEMEVIKIN